MLIISIGAGLAATGIAVIIGVAAAYLSGLWEGALNVLTDVLLVIPLFPLLIVIATYVQNSGTLVLIAVLTITGWSYTARQLRSQALSLRHRDFLEAARVRGERTDYDPTGAVLLGVATLLLLLPFVESRTWQTAAKWLLLVPAVLLLSLIYNSEPTRAERISYAAFCFKKQKP